MPIRNRLLLFESESSLTKLLLIKYSLSLYLSCAKLKICSAVRFFSVFVLQIVSVLYLGIQIGNAFHEYMPYQAAPGSTSESPYIFACNKKMSCSMVVNPFLNRRTHALARSYNVIVRDSGLSNVEFFLPAQMSRTKDSSQNEQPGLPMARK